MTPQLGHKIRLMGGFRLDPEGRSGLGVGAQRVIAALAAHHGMARGALAGLLWPDSSEARANGNLRTVLWRIARSSPGVVVVDRDRLVLHGSVDVDVHEFEEWARRVVADGDTIADADLTDRPHVDELLPDWHDEWVIMEREKLRQVRLHALEAVARLLGRRGRNGAAVDTALEAVRLEPLRESAQRTLIGLHLADGNASEAARQLDRFAALLWTELGLEPSPELARLVTTHLTSERNA